MAKYKTAKQLEMLPAERKALIAFVRQPTLGRIVSVNGHAHYYDQSTIDSPNTARNTECGTAGCVAGFVFAHARHVQHLKKLRNSAKASTYISHACLTKYNPETGDEPYVAPLLAELYGESGDYKLEVARKVVKGLLQKGKVVWPEMSSKTIIDWVD